MFLVANITQACRATVASLSDGKVWLYLVMPTLLALCAWMVLLIFSLGALSEVLMESPPLSFFVAWGMLWLAKILAVLSGWVSITGLAYLVGLAFTAIFILPVLLKHIAATQYPELVAAGKSFFGATALYSCAMILLFVLLWIITFPLWFLPGAALVLPLVLMAWLNYKTYTFEILADFSTTAEKKELLQKHATSLFLLGFLLAIVAHLPIVCLFAPGVTALAFSHYVLAALKDIRGEAVIVVESEKA